MEDIPERGNSTMGSQSHHVKSSE
uniref:Uncharacterized protein n=1 Tax=Arundo donax TaxID=35708 RepID=A0A0A9FTS7_ARUDO